MLMRLRDPAASDYEQQAFRIVLKVGRHFVSLNDLSYTLALPEPKVGRWFRGGVPTPEELQLLEALLGHLEAIDPLFVDPRVTGGMFRWMRAGPALLDADHDVFVAGQLELLFTNSHHVDWLHDLYLTRQDLASKRPELQHHLLDPVGSSALAELLEL
jgi:hypothetical protein